MAVRIGRIVKEFVFKNLLEQKTAVRLYGHRKEITCSIVDIQPQEMTLEVILGDLGSFRDGEMLQAYFFFQNNFHLFESTVLELGEGRLRITHPEGVYKNPQRKYARVHMDEEVEVFFTLKGGQTVSLNFPRSPRALDPTPEVSEHFDFSTIQGLYQTFREKMASRVSYGKIVMLRDKIPESYEEKLVAATGKALWIPSTEEDFPSVDPFPDERVIVRRELVKYEESFDRAAHVVASKLSNILYEKQKKRIHAELYCPVIYESYLIGYLYLCNRNERKERIDQELVDYVSEFARVLSYSLHLSGYFSATGGTADEHRYEAPVIDISASGLLFAHPRDELAQQLAIHTDLDITLRFAERRLVIGSRVRRKLQDSRRHYYGIQFLRLEDQDLAFLFGKLYGRPFSPEEEKRWEGGTPPPPLDLFGQ